MEENHQTVFRKKTLERISSPDQLTDYLCVTNPGIWVIADHRRRLVRYRNPRGIR